MSADLEVLLKRLHLANARRIWRDLVQRAEKEQWPHDQLLHTLFAEEVAHRRGTRLARAVRAARFPFLRTVEEFDFTYQSTLRLTTIGSLLAPDFVTEGGSVIFEGKPGRGKTHLAIAIAYRALQNGFDVLFTTAAELIDHLSAASRDGSMRDALAHYVRPHVLVVDEVGYLAYGDDAANVLYHVVNDRHIKRRAMVFTTNKNPKRWGDALHDDDLAEAIVDRILEHLDDGRQCRIDLGDPCRGLLCQFLCREFAAPDARGQRRAVVLRPLVPAHWQCHAIHSLFSRTIGSGRAKSTDRVVEAKSSVVPPTSSLR